LTAAITGTSQSSRASNSAYWPSSIMRRASPMILSGTSVERSGIAVGVAQVGAGAEEPVPGRGDHRTAGPVAGVEPVEDVAHPVPARRGQSVAGFGPVDGDPRHRVPAVEPDLLVEGSLIGHRGNLPASQAAAG